MIQLFIIIALVLAFTLLMYRFATEVKYNEVLEKKNIDLEKKNAALYKQVGETSSLHQTMINKRDYELQQIADALRCSSFRVTSLSSVVEASVRLVSEKERLVSDVIDKERQLSNLGTLKDKVTRLEGQIEQIEESRDEYVDEYHKTKAELNRFKFPQCHNLVYGQQIVLDHNYAYFRRIDGDAIIVMRPEQTTPQGGSFMLKAMDNKESVISLQDFEAGLVAGTITISPRKDPIMFKDAGEKV